MRPTNTLSARLFPVSLLLFLAVSAPAAPTTSTPAVPWRSGESLTYSIDWGLVHAAESTINVVEKPHYWEFHLHLVSKGAVDTFFPINDWFWSFTGKNPWRSLEYGEDRSEGNRRIKERTRVDYDKKIALREKWTKGGTDRIVFTQDQLDDIGSMLYTFRTGTWKKSDRRPVIAYESHQVKTGEAVCTGIFLRKFDPWPEQEVIELTCDPTGETKAKQKGRLVIWITNDARRLPLRAHLYFKYGTFEISLTNPGPTHADFKPETPAK